METIIIVLKGRLEHLPPMMTAMTTLVNLGKKISLVVDHCGDDQFKRLQDMGVAVHRIHEAVPKVRRKAGIIEKTCRWLTFRSNAWSRIEQIRKPDDLLWIASGDTAMALGPKLFSQKYVLHIHELYEYPRYQKGLKPYAKSASRVVVPEMCRAAICRVWWNLDRTPYVIPNKPLEHARTKKSPISSPELKAKIDELGDAKIVLYQGLIERRRPLDKLAKVIRDSKHDVRLILMGSDTDGFLAHLQTICPNLVYLGFVTPPHHLEITSHADIGIIQYDYSCLNHIFCAPNKIWEYSGFGIPILAADLPGIRFYFDRFHAGECCDFSSEAEIKTTLSKILMRLDDYKSGADRLYESCNISERYQNLLSEPFVSGEESP